MKRTPTQAPATDSPDITTDPTPAPVADSPVEEKTPALEGESRPVGTKTPALPKLPDTFTPKPYDGSLFAPTVAGYVPSFWRNTPADMMRAREVGVYFPRMSEGFFTEPALLHPSTEGYATIGDLVVGVEKESHYRQRKAEEARKASAFLEGLKRDVGKQDAANPQAAYTARFTQTVEERELPVKDEG
ncbi:MAG: hypothetical protein ACYC7E_18905 [Armatimonadota bacterium]